MLGSIHGLQLRQAAEVLVKSLYEDVYYDLAANTDITDTTPVVRDMEEWIILKGLPKYNYSKIEADELIYSIFEGATGYTVDKTKVFSTFTNNPLRAQSL